VKALEHVGKRVRAIGADCLPPRFGDVAGATRLTGEPAGQLLHQSVAVTHLLIEMIECGVGLLAAAMGQLGPPVDRLLPALARRQASRSTSTRLPREFAPGLPVLLRQRLKFIGPVGRVRSAHHASSARFITRC